MVKGFEFGNPTVIGTGPAIVSADGSGGSAIFATSYSIMRRALMTEEAVGATAREVSMYTGCASTSLQAAALTTVGPTPTGVPASGGVPTPQTGGGAPVELLEDPDVLLEDELLELPPVSIRPVVP